jgi:hypothetical protein
LLLRFSGFGIAEPFAVVALECSTEGRFALKFGELPVVVGEELQEGREDGIGCGELAYGIQTGIGEFIEEVANFSQDVGGCFVGDVAEVGGCPVGEEVGEGFGDVGFT